MNLNANDPFPRRAGRGNLSAAQANEIAVSALTFIASEPELLNRFCSVTGIDARSLRQAASDPQFLPSVLDFVLAHEPTLIAFAESATIEPASIGAARRILAPSDLG